MVRRFAIDKRVEIGFRNLVVKMLAQHGESQGEACLEFLLALATKRLALAERDIGRIAAAPREGLPSLVSIVLAYAVGGATENPDDPPGPPA